MTVAINDNAFVKSATVTNGSSNGGAPSYNEVQMDVKYGMFPRITAQQANDGVTLYRKFFWWNKDGAGDALASALLFLLFPSLGDSRYYLAAATDISDTQEDIDGDDINWLGCGQLNADITAGAETCAVAMKNNDYVFQRGQKIAVSSYFMTSQTVASDVKFLDAVHYSGGTWSKQTPPTEADRNIYPYGTHVGNNTVATVNTGHIEYRALTDTSYSNEVLYAASGSQSVFTGEAADHPRIEETSLEVKYTIATVIYTAYDNGDGTLSGTHLTTGTVNYNTGAISLTFDTNIDAGNITIGYAHSPYSWSGNVVTLETDQFENDYDADNTWLGACMNIGEDYGDIVSALGDWTVTSVGGAFDEGDTSPNNIGGVDDTFTITFTNATAFTCAGTLTGSVGTGSILSAFNPTNPNTGEPYFSIGAGAWSGTWTAGDTVEFTATSAKYPFWIKEVIPAGASAIAADGFLFETYYE
ncbi:hypothetical protein MCHI_003616 [Candidatus Magnetoovum chiemensis]|nr:hypothetical protein MCHI_003616 [Candidatus Magnetoovum chiemensis]